MTDEGGPRRENHSESEGRSEACGEHYPKTEKAGEQLSKKKKKKKKNQEGSV